MCLAETTDLMRREQRTKSAPARAEQRPNSTVAIAVRRVRRVAPKADPGPIQQYLRRHRESPAGGDKDLAVAHIGRRGLPEELLELGEGPLPRSLRTTPNLPDPERVGTLRGLQVPSRASSFDVDVRREQRVRISSRVPRVVERGAEGGEDGVAKLVTPMSPPPWCCLTKPNP
jgi:hypothetical protein